MTHAVVCADQYTSWDHAPPHLSLMMDKGVPIMVFGRPGPCQAVEHCIRGCRPDVEAVEVRIYVRPTVPPIGATHAYAVRTAYVIGVRDRLKPGIPNYVTVDAGHCMGNDNPPMPLVDLFVHALTRGPKADTVALYCKDPMTATLWSMVATKALDVVVGVLADTMDAEEWADAVMRGGDQPTPPGLEPEFRQRVQALLAQGIPGWAALEDAVLRDSWARKEREAAEADAKAVAKRAAKARAEALRAKAKAEKARQKAEAAAEEVKDEPTSHLIGIPESEEHEVPPDAGPATQEDFHIHPSPPEEDVGEEGAMNQQPTDSCGLPRVPSWHSLPSDRDEEDAEEREEEKDLPRAPGPAPPRPVAVDPEPRVEHALTQPPAPKPKPRTKAGGRSLSQGAAARSSEATGEVAMPSALQRMVTANEAVRSQDKKTKRPRKE